MEVPTIATGMPTARPYRPPQRLWPATPYGVHRARHALAETLAEWGRSELVDAAGLVLSELMGNAERHGRVEGRSTGVSVVGVEDGVLLEVHDTRDEQPTPGQAGALDEQGRGLLLVDALTGGRWGVAERQGPGKVVWALVTSADAEGH